MVGVLGYDGVYRLPHFGGTIDALVEAGKMFGACITWRKAQA